MNKENKGKENIKDSKVVYKKVLYGASSVNEFEELAKVFLKRDEFQFRIPTAEELNENSDNYLDENGCFDKVLLKKEIYNELSTLTGLKPPWGVTTGIRPIKMTGEAIRKFGDETKEYLMSNLLISEKKADLAIDICNYQSRMISQPGTKTVSVYIGIPFCPTRCYYCSFTSNEPKEDLVLKYMEALEKEIKYVGKNIEEAGVKVESIYVGGGTPTTLDEFQLEKLLRLIEENIIRNHRNDLVEFTVEAGRADTITEEKLKLLNMYQVNRISINPQSIHQATLEKIGRVGTFQQVKEAFLLARRTGNFEINMDIIAGLEGEGNKDFQETLKAVIGLNPDNITVHTLAVKRSSNLARDDKEANYSRGDIATAMLNEGKRVLEKAGYRPYYLYRQKHMAGSLENIGYSINDKVCLYNIRIMEENQTNIALGAGGISKIFFEEENRLERVANVVDVRIYNQRIEDMIKRKEENLFSYL